MLKLSNNRELFLDDTLIQTALSDVPQFLGRPEKKEIVFRFDQPWETNTAGYQNIVKNPDGSFSMYYLASSFPVQPDGTKRFTRRAAMLKSNDGLHWFRPYLGITDEPGGNMISPPGEIYDDNFFVFYDTNPRCPENERYKAITGDWGQFISVRVSSDGIHFSPKRHFLTFAEHHCYFDSLNTVHYDAANDRYVAYVRGLHMGDDFFPQNADDPRIVRDIRVSYSKDFIEWTYPQPLEYNDAFDYQMYTNGVFHYDRAPQYWLGLPTRYIARPWSKCFDDLPDAEERQTRSRGTALTDAILMFTRDGSHFTRFSEGFFTAGPERTKNWLYGDCYPCVGQIVTPGEYGSDDYLSLFCHEADDTGMHVLVRYALRMDGFAYRYAGYGNHKLISKPLIFDGSRMEINYRTSAIGSLLITITDKNGNAITSGELFGDKVDRTVPFEGDLSAFAGKPVTITFAVSDASLYSFRFF